MQRDKTRPKKLQFNRFMNHIVLGAIACLCIGPVAILVGVFMYTTTPWPSPPPYPNTTVTEQSGSAGTWGLTNTKTYTTNAPIVDIFDHYAGSAKNYCLQEPAIIKKDAENNAVRLSAQSVPVTIELGECITMQCPIRRWQLDQDFTVQLCQETTSLLSISQTDAWED